MFPAKVLSFLVLVIAVLMSACSPPTVIVRPTVRQPQPVVVRPATPKRVTVSEQDSGRTIRLNVGDTLLVALSSNASTGYSWELEPLRRSVLRSVSTSQAGAGGNLLGGGGETIFRFRAEGPGQTQLSLIYRRPFEENISLTRVFEISVSVSR